MIIKIEGICQMEDCNKPATHIASGRQLYPGGHPDPACYCGDHSIDIADERSPEYNVECPNCNCLFGVN